MKPPSRHVVLICSAGLLIPVIARAQDADLYDPSVLRTLELEFEVPNFFARIDQISTSTEDGYLAGDLTVDGVTYPGVGVRFRGNTSQRNAGEKRSFKISINHTDPDQRLDGFRTLKLNNAAGDPTFLREVLYSRICSEYGPSPTANHVVLTINGENWGVYINVQQFNKDFLRQWFDRTSGNRFKAPSGGGTGPRGPRPPRCNLPGGNFACGYRALMWLGERPPEYQRYYELNSDEQPDPWGDLVRFCDVFNHATDDVFEQRVATILDVDGALWMIALENVFGDHDGYLFKGADYTIYQEPPLPGQESPPGRLHVAVVQEGGIPTVPLRQRPLRDASQGLLVARLRPQVEQPHAAQKVRRRSRIAGRPRARRAWWRLALKVQAGSLATMSDTTRRCIGVRSAKSRSASSSRKKIDSRHSATVSAAKPLASFIRATSAGTAVAASSGPSQVSAAAVAAPTSPSSQGEGPKASSRAASSSAARRTETASGGVSSRRASTLDAVHRTRSSLSERASTSSAPQRPPRPPGPAPDRPAPPAPRPRSGESPAPG